MMSTYKYEITIEAEVLSEDPIDYSKIREKLGESIVNEMSGVIIVGDCDIIIDSVEIMPC